MAGTTTSGAARATSVDDPGFAARIRERDAQALEEVVRRYLPQILRAARGADFAPQLAEDVAQDTFVTRSLSTTMGHSTGLIREQCPVW